MSRFITTRLKGLAAEVGTLKDSVRVAVAGELAGAIAGAVRDVVGAAVAGRPVLAPSSRPQHRPVRSRHEWDDEPDAWDEDDDEGYGSAAPRRHRPATEFDAGEQVAVLAAAVQVARWWLARRGSVVGAAGAGLLAAVTGLCGGAAVRAGLAAVGVTTDLLAVTAALGEHRPTNDDD